MMPSSPIHLRTQTRHSGRLSTASAPTCVDTPDWPETASLIGSPQSRNTPFTRSRPHPHPFFEAKRRERPVRSNIIAPHATAKSP
jgi:hypothetical protein